MFANELKVARKVLGRIVGRVVKTVIESGKIEMHIATFDGDEFEDFTRACEKVFGDADFDVFQTLTYSGMFDEVEVIVVPNLK